MNVPNSPEELLALQMQRECRCRICQASKAVSALNLRFHELAEFSSRITESLLAHSQDQLMVSDARAETIAYATLMGKLSTHFLASKDVCELVQAFTSPEQEIDCEGADEN